jgi:hypothetical protein
MATTSAQLNQVGPVSVCLEGPSCSMLYVRVYNAAGRFLCETWALARLVDAALLIKSLQLPPIGFN